jgi:stage II sporulation protein D
MRGWTARALMAGVAAVLAVGGPAACQSTGGLESVFNPDAPEPTNSPAGSTSSTASTAKPLPVVSTIPRGVVRGVAGEPEMRIRLLANATQADLSSEIKTIWASAVDDRRPPARLTGPVRVVLLADAWQLTDPAGVTARFDRDREIIIAGESDPLTPPRNEQGQPVAPGATAGGTGGLGSAASRVGGSMVTLNGRRYPGVLKLTAAGRSGATFDVIEEVNLERYLQGVVAAEMFKNWPIDAYRTQAVAARSYALHERARARSRGERFDVEATVQDQAYDGATLNLPAAQAVVDTRGVAVTWNGEVLRTYYSSTCGGRPGSARDTWPVVPGFEYNLIGPIQAQAREHACQGATYYRWSVARTRSDVARRFREFGLKNGLPLRSFTNLERVSVESTNPAGRPSRFLVVQDGGQSYSLSGEELRRAFNQPVAGLPPITPATRVHSSDLSVFRNGEQIAINGQGFGHGVGMCQWCAKGFADRTERWDITIMRFYPGAKLERLY